MVEVWEQRPGWLADLLALKDQGMAVVEAARQLGVSPSWACEVLRSLGLGSPVKRTRVTAEHRHAVLVGFEASGSVDRAAKAGGVGRDAARSILRRAGAVPAVVPLAQRRAQAATAKEQFHALLEQGIHLRAAATRVGIHETTGSRWYDQWVTSRGLTLADPPASTDPPASAEPTAEASEPARYLTLGERLLIADGLQNRLTLSAIAGLIGKHKSSVSREVRAHTVTGVYLPRTAHAHAAAGRARPKPSKLNEDSPLRQYVQEGLEQHWSPEQIANRLIQDNPGDETMRVSHETIYQALYLQARGGLRREVAQALRTGRARRKPHAAPGTRRSRFKDEMVMIAERPAEVEDRAVPGHWEGDLITGELNKSAIGTLVERTTRYTMLLHLPAGHTAEHVRDALLASITTLPAHLRGSLTWDQGSEMAAHKQITLATDMQVYFCDPASPWQRGSNENTNGLLRQYFPKGTDLTVHGPEELELVAQELNGRPRKTLGWATPAERLRDLLQSEGPTGVASTP